jgi:hypothetical protein
MARSSYVYIVLKDYDTYYFADVVAAFTVKHELAAWLDNNGWDKEWVTGASLTGA